MLLRTRILRMVVLAIGAVTVSCSRPVFPQCANDEECSPRSVCRERTCVILGEGKCRLPDACKAPENATATCADQTCGFNCNPGYHLCWDACVLESAESCGPECVRCDAPQNGTASCEGGRCISSCPEGSRACSDRCVPGSGICAPENLTYAESHAFYTVGVAIAHNVPSSSGGRADDYSVSPELPPGLSLDRSIGIISGSPTEVHDSAIYTITAMNESGLASTQLTIAVSANIPGIAAGGSHTCALINGAVKCWGSNHGGQLGNGSPLYIAGEGARSYLPVQVTGLTSGVQAIAAGGAHTCAVLPNGVKCWGSNRFGQLGSSSTATVESEPVQVIGLSGGAQAIAANSRRTCAVVNGSAWCWGDECDGATPCDRHAGAVQVPGLTNGVEAISLGEQHACAVLSGGAVCWGHNDWGQLGTSLGNRAGPTSVYGLQTGVQAIAAGLFHTCAVVEDGARCWGINHFGQLGDDSRISRSMPVQVSGLTSGVQIIAAGGDTTERAYGGDGHTCAIVNGGAWCWGSNMSGEIGNNSIVSESHVPDEVFGLASDVRAIAAGSKHTCAIVHDGVQCWGWNSDGQLGNDWADMCYWPVAVLGL